MAQIRQRRQDMFVGLLPIRHAKFRKIINVGRNMITEDRYPIIAPMMKTLIAEVRTFSYLIKGNVRTSGFIDEGEDSEFLADWHGTKTLEESEKSKVEGTGTKTSLVYEAALDTLNVPPKLLIKRSPVSDKLDGKCAEN